MWAGAVWQTPLTPNKESWSAEYAELKGLLSEDEYAAARASSTLNAHYTSPTVIRGIYDAVERMGFQSGNISGAVHGRRQLLWNAAAPAWQTAVCTA